MIVADARIDRLVARRDTVVARGPEQERERRVRELQMLDRAQRIDAVWRSGAQVGDAQIPPMKSKR